MNGFAIDGNQFFDTPPLQVHIGEASESASGYFEFQTKDTFKLKVDERNSYANFPEDTCFFPPIASLPYQSFADGIGFFESFRPTFEDWDELHRYLIYFKKPWGEWGTPIDFNTVSIPAEPHNVIQLSNSPNPFANQTAFNYNLGNVFGKNIKLVIMNILGAVVEEIPIAQESGRLTWNGQHQSTGTYLYELVVDGQSTINGKMVMHGGKERAVRPAF